MSKAIDFDEIADIYDYYVTTDLDINFFREEMQNKSGPVLELMCGTGRVSIPLITQGVQLTCVDYSRGMLVKFQEKLDRLGLHAELIEGDIQALELGRAFDTIFIPFNFFMELTHESSQLAALKTIHRHLNSNGVFICTLHNPALRIGPADGEKRLRGEFQLPNDKGLKLYSQEHYDPHGKTIYGTQFFVFCDEQGAPELERRIDIRFSLIAPSYFETMVQKSGFTVLDLYGNYDRSAFDPAASPFMIYFLGKA